MKSFHVPFGGGRRGSKLHKPIIVQRLRHGLERGVEAGVELDFRIQRGEHGGDFLLRGERR